MRHDPWDDIEQRYFRGKQLTGRITVVTDYGCYVETEPGVEALVLTGDEGIANLTFRPGVEIDVVVVDVDAKRRRISLGLVHPPPD